MPQPVGQNSRTFIGRLVAAAFLLTLLAGKAHAENVRAEDYQSFWLWAGVRPQPALQQADELYILAGEISRHRPPRIFSQRSATPRIKGKKLWIVYRVQSIDWNEKTRAAVLLQVEKWQANSNNLVGLQLDFDAATKNLDRYAEFLAGIRGALPSQYKLSVTGLLDWSTNGDPKGLDALAGVVDEVVLQIYRGRKVIPGYATYLKKLDNMKVNFRIGLLQGGEWEAPPGLKENRYFTGYLVFLLNDVK